MKITVPFAYTVQLRRVRHRSDEHTWLRSETEIDITEVDEHHSEVVHIIGEHRDTVHRERSYSRYSKDNHHLPFGMIDGRKCLVREHEGHLYAERGTIEQFALAANSTEEGLHNPFNGRICTSGNPNIMGIGNHHELFSSREEFVAKKKYELKSWETRYEQDLENVHIRAQDFIVVAGSVYEKVREPILVARIDSDILALQIEERPDIAGLDFSPLHGRDASQHHLRFGIDELHRAITEGHRLAAIEGLEFVCFAEVEHVSTWDVRFRGDQDYLIMQAGGLVHTGLQVMQRLRSDFGLAVHDLAAYMSEHHRLSPAAISMARRIVAMREGIDEVDFRTWSSDVENVRGAIDRLEHALVVWDTRPEGGLDWSDKVLDETSIIDGGLRAWEISSVTDADLVSFDIGCDLEGPVRDAAAGNGRLIAVEDVVTGVVQSAVYLSELGEDDDAAVVFARQFFEGGPAALGLARKFRDEAGASIDALDREMALLDF